MWIEREARVRLLRAKPDLCVLSCSLSFVVEVEVRTESRCLRPALQSSRQAKAALRCSWLSARDGYDLNVLMCLVMLKNVIVLDRVSGTSHHCQLNCYEHRSCLVILEAMLGTKSLVRPRTGMPATIMISVPRQVFIKSQIQSRQILKFALRMAGLCESQAKKTRVVDILRTERLFSCSWEHPQVDFNAPSSAGKLRSTVKILPNKCAGLSPGGGLTAQ